MKRACVALVAMVSLASATAYAGDWPRFRGPTGQGVSAETGLPTLWSATDNVAWKLEIPGQGWSSPIIYGDRVFITTATDAGTSCRILCIDRKTGQLLWNTEVFKQDIRRKESKNSYATPTPATDGKTVYAVFGGGSIAAVDFAGKILWTHHDVKFYSQHGLGASPIIHEDLLIQPYDGSSETGDRYVGWQKPWDKSFILALDRRTGKEKWRARRGMSRIAHVTPQVAEVDGKPQLISAAGDVIQGHDLKSGELIWTASSVGEGVVPSVVIGEGLVFTAAGFGKPAIRATRPGGTGDVTKTHIVWEQTDQVPTMSSFVYHDGRLYTAKENGFAMCLDARTGKPLWKQRIGGTHSASPVVADGKVYFLSEEGEATVIEAGAEFKLIAKNRIPEKCQASYAVSGGQIFIRTEKNLYCIGKESGQ